MSRRNQVPFQVQLIKESLQAGEGAAGQGVIGIILHGVLVVSDGFLPITLFLPGTAEIVKGVAIRFITLGLDGFFKPGNSIIKLVEFNKVRTNIVIRISIVGIERNGLAALFNGRILMSLEAVSPAKKGVGFGCGKGVDRFLVKLDRFFNITLGLFLIAFLEDAKGLFAGYVFIFLAHGFNYTF